MPEIFEKGRVSVIIPTYNRAHILMEALDSVWAQTYRPVELLVIDDGSVDDTALVVAAWQQAHPGNSGFELRYFRQANSGAPAARNLGLIQSQGEYIQFLDSDDILYPTMLTQVVKAFEATDCEFVHTGYNKICHECGGTLFSYVPGPETEALVAYMYDRLHGNTISISRRRVLAQEIGPWNEALAIDQDGDYMVRTILRAPRMTVIQERLWSYLVRRGSKINDRKDSREAWLCRLQRESKFCAGIKGKEDLPSKAKGAYAQRLYQLALSLHAVGMFEIGDAYGKLADGIQGATLTWRGRLMQTFWHHNKRAYVFYEWLRGIKQHIQKSGSGQQKKRPACPVCGR
jgi:glycosyltransferase involved in cell wall biosynthesis